MEIHGPNVRRVIMPLLEKHQQPWAHIISRSRRAPIVKCRHEIFIELKKELQWSAARIGKLCGKDHTTVLHALKKRAGECSPS
jgi:chromosomal replication initiation ATPase DnaA